MNVDTKWITHYSGFDLTVLSATLSTAIAFEIPKSITGSGYFCSTRKDFNSCKRTCRFGSSDIIVLSLRAKLNGMFILVCLGWQE